MSLVLSAVVTASSPQHILACLWRLLVDLASYQDSIKLDAHFHIHGSALPHIQKHKLGAL